MNLNLAWLIPDGCVGEYPGVGLVCIRCRKNVPHTFGPFLALVAHLGAVVETYAQSRGLLKSRARGTVAPEKAPDLGLIALGVQEAENHQSQNNEESNDEQNDGADVGATSGTAPRRLWDLPRRIGHRLFHYFDIFLPLGGVVCAEIDGQSASNHEQNDNQTHDEYWFDVQIFMVTEIVSCMHHLVFSILIYKKNHVLCKPQSCHDHLTAGDLWPESKPKTFYPDQCRQLSHVE